MERRPIEIYGDAIRAEKEGHLDRAIDLYKQASYFHQAARIALATEKPLLAVDLFYEGKDSWSAEKVLNGLGLLSVKQEITPLSLYKEAKIAHGKGQLDKAIDLYRQAGHYGESAALAERKSPRLAATICLEAGDLSMANGYLEKYGLEPILLNVPRFYRSGEAPVYKDRADLVVPISQGEKGITHSMDDKPVLATWDIGPCIAVAGYEPNKKIGFLAHYDGNENIDWSISDLETALKEQGPLEFETTLVASIMWGSLKNYSKIKEAFNKKRKIMNCRITEEDYFDNHIKAIALDTRTGTKYYFDNKSYGFSLNMPQILSAISLSTLVYNPFKK